jgi:hypothetical protein
MNAGKLMPMIAFAPSGSLDSGKIILGAMKELL